MLELSQIRAGVFTVCVLLIFILYRPLRADPPPDPPDTLSAVRPSVRAVPRTVAEWVRKNLPGCNWPEAEDYEGDVYSKQQFVKHLESNDGWPPWCARGDFNNDGKDDYAFVVIRQDTTESGIPVWHHYYVLLHSTDSGYVRFLPPFGDWLPGGLERGGYSWLSRLPPGEYMYRSKYDSSGVNIPHDAIRVVSADWLSIQYWLWNGTKYENGYLYAD